MIDQKALDSVLAEVDEKRIVRYTQDLIRINSVNPNLAKGSSEEQVVDFLASTCRKEGLQVKIREVASHRPNFYCELPGEEQGFGLAFLGHTDTVPLLGMDDALSGDVVDGHIWGRGSVDMKGGLAASIQALISLARSGIRLKKGVTVWAVADEESEHRGAYALKDHGMQADYCIVAEPSDTQLVLGCKGTCPVRIDIQGVLAHGSTPWQGVNAINKAAKVITALNQLPRRKVWIPDLEDEIQSSINVGVITGGTQYNNVADSCSIFLDRRMIPGETQASCLKEIQGILEQLASEDSDFKGLAEISRPDWHWDLIKSRGLNPALTSLSNPISQAVQTSHFFVKNQQTPIGFFHGYCDMDFTVNDLGIPTVHYGPGEEKYCHTAEERLHIGQLLDANRVYLTTAIQLLR